MFVGVGEGPVVTGVFTLDTWEEPVGTADWARDTAAAVTWLWIGEGMAAMAGFTWITNTETGCRPTIPAIPAQVSESAWPLTNLMVTLELSFLPL